MGCDEKSLPPHALISRSKIIIIKAIINQMGRECPEVEMGIPRSKMGHGHEDAWPHPLCEIVGKADMRGRGGREMGRQGWGGSGSGRKGELETGKLTKFQPTSKVYLHDFSFSDGSLMGVSEKNLNKKIQQTRKMFSPRSGCRSGEMTIRDLIYKFSQDLSLRNKDWENLSFIPIISICLKKNQSKTNPNRCLVSNFFNDLPDKRPDTHFFIDFVKLFHSI